MPLAFASILAPPSIAEGRVNRRLHIGPTTRVAVLGAGVEGKAVIAWLNKVGCSDITVCDRNDRVVLPPGVKAQLGDDYLRDLGEFEVVFRSPGLPRDVAGIIDAEERGTLVTSATREFFARCPCTIVGITGSVGKSTTTDLIAHLLSLPYGESLRVGGNDHRPLLDQVDAIERDHCVVMELSSFQLVDLDRSPSIAVVLNVAPNHLDVHATMEAYIEAKTQIVAHQTERDYAVLNWSFDNVRHMGERTPAKKVYFNTSKGEEVAFVHQGKLILRWGGVEEAFLTEEEVPFLTNHDNILAAMLTAKLFGVETKDARDRILSFRGRPHCLELVRELAGVRYFDDSGATTPEAAINAIKSFPDGKVVIIAGGSDKGLDYDSLAKEIVRSRVVALLIGETKERIAAAIARAAQKFRATAVCESFPGLEDAVQAAHGRASSGQVVLLSPACASFDMFKNADQRGDRFHELVKGLS